MITSGDLIICSSGKGKLISSDNSKRTSSIVLLEFGDWNLEDANLEPFEAEHS